MSVFNKYNDDTRTFGQGNANLYAADQTSGKKITPFKPDVSATPIGGSASGVTGNSAPVNAGGTNPSNKELYGGGGSDDIDPSTVYLDEIQKAASEKNYKTLLQSDIAAYNLKMGTQKYLNNALAAKGLGTQGYGTSAHVGVENQAQNLYAQNLENYNEAEATALSEAQARQKEEEEKTIAEAKAEATESDNQLVTFLQYSDGSEESVAGYMDKYGYVQGGDGYWYKKDKDGKPDTSQPASAYVMAAVQSATENASSGAPTYGSESSNTVTQGAQNALTQWASSYSGIDKNGYGSVSDLRSAVVGRVDNEQTGTLESVIKNELDYLEARINTGTIADGTLFKLQRGSGRGEAYLVLYYGGRLYIVSDDDREQEGYQVSSRYSQYQGPKEEIIGK